MKDNLLEVGQNAECACANGIRLNFGRSKECGQGNRGCVLPLLGSWKLNFYWPDRNCCNWEEFKGVCVREW